MRRTPPAHVQRAIEQVRRKGLRRDMFAAEIIGPVLLKGDNLTLDEAVAKTFHLANMMLHTSAKLIQADMEAIETAIDEFERDYAIHSTEGPKA